MWVECSRAAVSMVIVSEEKHIILDDIQLARMVVIIIKTTKNNNNNNNMNIYSLLSVYSSSVCACVKIYTYFTKK